MFTGAYKDTGKAPRNRAVAGYYLGKAREMWKIHKAGYLQVLGEYLDIAWIVLFARAWHACTVKDRQLGEMSCWPEWVSICSSFWNWDAPSESWVLSLVTMILWGLLHASEEKRNSNARTCTEVSPYSWWLSVISWLSAIYIRCCAGWFFVGFVFLNVLVSSFRYEIATFCTKNYFSKDEHCSYLKWGENAIGVKP